MQTIEPGSADGEATGVIDAGLLLAETQDAPDPNVARAYFEEKAAVKQALYEIEQARNFDRDYWTQMGIDRAYARGDSQHDVNVNLIGSALDTMTAFLYARDPDVSVTAATKTEEPRVPPPVLDPNVQRGMADPRVMADPQMREMTEMALAQHQQAMQAYQAEMAQRKDIRDTAKRFCETLEIVISRTWYVSKMKRAMRKVVRSSLTTSLGWLKVTWQERRGMDPITLQQIADLQANIQNLTSTQAGIEDGTIADTDAALQSLREQMIGLQAQVEVVISKGMAIDMISPDDITLPLGLTSVLDYLDSPWIDHRTYMTLDDALARYGNDDDDKRRKIKKASRYSQRRPFSSLTAEPQQYARVLAEGEVSINPSQFTAGVNGENPGGEEIASEGAGDFVCVHERWDRDMNLIRTMIEGVECYVVPPHAPDVATTRFYPFFGLAFTEVDGTRYPQSKVFRTEGLQDEYNARRSSWKLVRQRNRQGVLANAGACETDDAGKIVKSEDGEWTFFKVRPDVAMNSVFMPKPITAPIPELYDTDPILRDFEREWGLQEAIQGSVQTSKTATEAEIQQQGFGTRTGFQRDYVEDLLNDVAMYSAEILIQKITPEDAKAMAGDAAVWPSNIGVEELGTLVNVKIRAGSTGKPNSSREREAWAQTMPMMQNLIMLVGELRGASKPDIADKLEVLGEISLLRSGDSIDIETLMPQAGDMSALPAMPSTAPPMGQTPGEPPMPTEPMPQGVQ